MLNTVRFLAAIALACLASNVHAAPRSAASAAIHIRCTIDGRPMADWRGNAVRFKGDREWSTVQDDAAGPMMVLLWAGGAKCHPAQSAADRREARRVARGRYVADQMGIGGVAPRPGAKR
jgi:hypothetical protein